MIARFVMDLVEWQHNVLGRAGASPIGNWNFLLVVNRNKPSRHKQNSSRLPTDVIGHDFFALLAYGLQIFADDLE